MRRLALTLTGDYAIWIGLRRNADGKFSRWNDNTRLTYRKWRKREPSRSSSDENCVEMFRWSGTWSDTTCEGRFPKKHAFICEIGK